MSKQLNQLVDQKFLLKIIQNSFQNNQISIQEVEKLGGLSNYNFKLLLQQSKDNDQILQLVYKKYTNYFNILIDRQIEKLVASNIQKYLYSNINVIYLDENQRIQQFIDKQNIPVLQITGQISIFMQIAEQIAKFHSFTSQVFTQQKQELQKIQQINEKYENHTQNRCKLNIEKLFQPIVLSQLENATKNSKIVNNAQKKEIFQIINTLKDANFQDLILNKIPSKTSQKLVYAHNDLNSTNFLYNQKPNSQNNQKQNQNQKQNNFFSSSSSHSSFSSSSFFSLNNRKTASDQTDSENISQNSAENREKSENQQDNQNNQEYQQNQEKLKKFENEIQIIDYEFVGLNYRFYEFGNFFNEITWDYEYPEKPYFTIDPSKYPSEKAQKFFFAYYLINYDQKCENSESFSNQFFVLNEEKLSDIKQKLQSFILENEEKIDNYDQFYQELYQIIIEAVFDNPNQQVQQQLKLNFEKEITDLIYESSIGQMYSQLFWLEIGILSLAFPDLDFDFYLYIQQRHTQLQKQIQIFQ
ncbi:Protein kinase-like domain [Pseudocohnilembus persalinus]|uniref:Protein kinase-like domain n=1 Tax=Pseudocohnilembus persalinus TaxID=266149 RepID=A0A0V0QDH9_PSEPJ|nr:Protein kinase-like domain [Pseudocohnilembus persalinus]|eukprot:KRX00251.1 Protein kinase-like domain [Pseudocohnilembus persalinus]